jgi:hypothetical protein
MKTIYDMADTETLEAELAEYRDLMDEALAENDLHSAAYYRGQMFSIKKALAKRA